MIFQRDPLVSISNFTCIIVSILYVLRVSAANSDKQWILTLRTNFTAINETNVIWQNLWDDTQEADSSRSLYRCESPKFGAVFMTANIEREKVEKIWSQNKELISSYDEYSKITAPTILKPKIPNLLTEQGLQMNDTKFETTEKSRIAHLKKQLLPQNLYSDTNQGEGVTIYLIGAGINTKHPELEILLQEKRLEIIFAGPNPSNISQADEGSVLENGGAIAGLVLGEHTGLARKVSGVVVNALDKDGKSSPALYLDALIKVYDHIIAKNTNKPVIINLSMHTGILGKSKDESLVLNDLMYGLRRVWEEFKELKNVLFVTAAGNAEVGWNASFQQWPLSERDTASNLIIVEGADENALLTSAVLANYISKNQYSVVDAKKELYENAHSRSQIGPLKLLNGENPTENGLKPATGPNTANDTISEEEKEELNEDKDLPEETEEDDDLEAEEEVIEEVADSTLDFSQKEDPESESGGDNSSKRKGHSLPTQTKVAPTPNRWDEENEVVITSLPEMPDMDEVPPELMLDADTTVTETYLNLKMIQSYTTVYHIVNPKNVSTRHPVTKIPRTSSRTIDLASKSHLGLDVDVVTTFARFPQTDIIDNDPIFTRGSKTLSTASKKN